MGFFVGEDEVESVLVQALFDQLVNGQCLAHNK